MSPPRLRERPLTAGDELVARAASLPPSPVPSEGWQRVLRDAERAPRPTLPWAAAALAVALVGVVVLRRADDSVPPAPPVHALTADARWSERAPRELVLERGRFHVTRAANEPPILLLTDDVTLELSVGKFLAEVTEGGTVVQVEEGSVVVRGEGRTVRAGERAEWPPTPAIPSGLSALPSSSSECGALEPVAQQPCLEAEAKGTTLRAQAALFELAALQAQRGQHAAALATWQQWLARFPEGVLHPEARLALFVELIRVRRFDEARAAAAEFERACAGDPRLPEVARLRDALPSAR